MLDLLQNRLKKKIEDSNKTTTWYVRDASGNIMATYNQTDSQFNGINTKELHHKESPLFGSSRLGIQNFDDRLVDFEVEYDPTNPNTPVIMGNRIMQDIEIAELQYDSPATPNNGVEEHFGEFLTLYNKGEIALPLNHATVYSKTYQNERVNFPAGLTLEPKQTLIVAYGTQANQNDFITLNNLNGSDLLADTSVIWFWQTSLRLHDEENRVILGNTIPSATDADQFTIADLVDYHQNLGNTYNNKYYDITLTQFTSLRPTVQSLRKEPQYLSTPNTNYFSYGAQYEEAVYNLSQLPFNDTSILEDQVFEEFGPTHAINFTSGKTLLTQQNGISLQWPLKVVSDFKRERGSKVYELSNHLGNVLVTVSDKKQGVDTDGDNEADYYQANVLSANDYYPFGWSMPGRKFNSGDYRFGFNGKEEDKEWGSQVIQDYGFRIYNPSIGKFLSVDPLTASYPWLTPYQFASNTPIMAIDVDGLEGAVRIAIPQTVAPKLSVSHSNVGRPANHKWIPYASTQIQLETLHEITMEERMNEGRNSQDVDIQSHREVYITAKGQPVKSSYEILLENTYKDYGRLSEITQKVLDGTATAEENDIFRNHAATGEVPDKSKSQGLLAVRSADMEGGIHSPDATLNQLYSRSARSKKPQGAWRSKEAINRAVSKYNFSEGGKQVVDIEPGDGIVVFNPTGSYPEQPKGSKGYFVIEATRAIIIPINNELHMFPIDETHRDYEENYTGQKK